MDWRNELCGCNDLSILQRLLLPYAFGNVPIKFSIHCHSRMHTGYGNHHLNVGFYNNNRKNDYDFDFDHCSFHSYHDRVC